MSDTDDLIERAHHLALCVFKGETKADYERARHNAAVLANAIDHWRQNERNHAALTPADGGGGELECLSGRDAPSDEHHKLARRIMTLCGCAPASPSLEPGACEITDKIVAMLSMASTMVYCVRCVDSEGDVVHVFSSRETLQKFLDGDQRGHTIYDYVIDCPERMEQVSQ